MALPRPNKPFLAKRTTNPLTQVRPGVSFQKARWPAFLPFRNKKKFICLIPARMSGQCSLHQTHFSSGNAFAAKIATGRFGGQKTEKGKFMAVRKCFTVFTLTWFTPSQESGDIWGFCGKWWLKIGFLETFRVVIYELTLKMAEFH